MKKFLIINGPNMNMLGKREPGVYGDLSLDEIINFTEKRLENDSVALTWFQSNIEGEIVSKIQSAIDEDYSALIINPAGYTYSSVAILDALKMLKCPVIEVHLTNTYCREDFRQKNITTKASQSVLEGFGKNSYFMAINSQLR